MTAFQPKRTTVQLKEKRLKNVKAFITKIARAKKEQTTSDKKQQQLQKVEKFQEARCRRIEAEILTSCKETNAKEAARIAKLRQDAVKKRSEEEQLRIYGNREIEQDLEDYFNERQEWIEEADNIENDQAMFEMRSRMGTLGFGSEISEVFGSF